MKNQKTLVLALLIIFLCVGGAFAIYYFDEMATKLRIQHESLAKRLFDINNEIDKLEEQNEVFILAFKELANINMTPGGISNIDFYTDAQRTIQRSGTQIISSSPSTIKDGRINMKMTVAGDYYRIIKSLADVRSLHNVIRVTSLNLSSAQPSGNVKADVILEASLLE